MSGLGGFGAGAEDAGNGIAAGDAIGLQPFILLIQEHRGRGARAVVAVNETNHFALMVFGKNDNPDIIKTFGFSSSKEMDKFAKYDYFEELEIKILKSIIGYMLLEKVDTIENETHTLFIGKVIDANKFKEDEAMTYSYYQEHKEELLRVRTEKGKTAWVCSVCGYVYYGEELPDDFTCPVCLMSKKYFNQKID